MIKVVILLIFTLIIDLIKAGFYSALIVLRLNPWLSLQLWQILVPLLLILHLLLKLLDLVLLYVIEITTPGIHL